MWEPNGIGFWGWENFAFLDLPQVFQWLMMPALAYGVYRILRRATRTSRFVVLYFPTMILRDGMFENLQGPRHRYQLGGLIALFQVYGGVEILKQLLPLRRGDCDDRLTSLRSTQ